MYEDFSYYLLNQMYRYVPIFRWRTIEHCMLRCRGNLQLMEQLDLIGQTSEFARVFGIEFYHVLSRGSQVTVIQI